ncbi:unnamed protein product [Hymenolepis diminuta]|uniref:Dynein light chain n=1 Tax=Hymenolepis diminuta TaxID=6216 RepID=A0A564ZA26_HYMDI|nr:unnamed protein product [Hymenolepis diminuta]
MKYAVILYSEAKEDMMKKIMYVVEEEINRSESETSRIRNIKDHLDDVFGPNWNIFMADCRCWSLKTYKQGTNVVFEYDNMVYDIYQAPENTPNVQTKGPFCPLYN